MAKQKSFKVESPAAALIDAVNMADTQKQDNTQDTQTPESVADTQQARKTKRQQYLVYPELVEKVKKIAYMERKSVNSLINDLLERYCTENAEKLEQYEKIFNVD